MAKAQDCRNLSRMIVENCILVVYQLAFDDVTCYNAGSSNWQTPNPSGAASFISQTYNREIT